MEVNGSESNTACANGLGLHDPPPPDDGLSLYRSWQSGSDRDLRPSFTHVYLENLLQIYKKC